MMLNFQTYLDEIYNNVFCKIYTWSFYVFLCGGSDKTNIRNKVRVELEKRGFQVLYPEDLFMDLLNRDKKTNLLEFENLLADNSDVVCIICESMGSAVELGAFTQNELIRDKMVAAIEKKYKRALNFINLGPIKLLKQKDDERVVIYQKEKIVELSLELNKVFNKIHNKRKRRSFKLDNFASFITFIPLLIYFFKTLDRGIIHKELKLFLTNRNFINKDYNYIFNAVLKYLLNARIIIANFDSEKEHYTLSNKGYEIVEEALHNSSQYERTLLHDRIRFAILKAQMN